MDFLILSVMLVIITLCITGNEGFWHGGGLFHVYDIPVYPLKSVWYIIYTIMHTFLTFVSMRYMSFGWF